MRKMTDEILSEAVIQRAIIKGVKMGMVEALGKLRRKLKRLDGDGDMLDRILEDIIPEEISGDKRFALKDQIKKRLKEDGTIR